MGSKLHQQGDRRSPQRSSVNVMRSTLTSARICRQRRVDRRHDHVSLVWRADDRGSEGQRMTKELPAVALSMMEIKFVAPPTKSTNSSRYRSRRENTTNLEKPIVIRSASELAVLTALSQHESSIARKIVDVSDVQVSDNVCLPQPTKAMNTRS